MRSPDDGADTVCIDRTALHSRRDTAGRWVRDARPFTLRQEWR